MNGFTGVDASRGGRATMTPGGSALAENEKLAHDSAYYQATPNGSARCSTCALFVAPASCKVVSGAISPSGWCVLYAHRR